MEDPLRKRLKPTEINQLDALTKHIEWLEDDVHFFGLLFYDTPELGELLREFIQETFQKNDVAFQASEEFKIKPKVLGNNVSIIHSAESASISFLTNLNVSRDGLICRAAKLIFILPETSFSDWSFYAFDFLSRASGGACHFHDLAKYDVVGEPNFKERDAKVTALKKEYSKIKRNPASQVLVVKLLSLLQTIYSYSEYSFAFEVATLAYSQAKILSQPYLCAEALRYKAICSISQGQLKQAMKLLKEEEAIREKLADIRGFINLYATQVSILSIWGQLDEAMALNQKVEKLCLAFGDRKGLARAYSNQANILSSQGKLREAMDLYKKQEEIAMAASDTRQLIASYASQASILRAWGELEESMRLHKKEEKLKEGIVDKHGLAKSYGDQAIILAYWGRLDEAMDLHKKEENILRQFKDKHGLSVSYGNQTLLCFAQGKLDEAMKFAKKQEELSLELNNLQGLASSYGNQGLILADWGRLDEAMSIYKKEEEIKIKLGDKQGLANSYGNQASILREWGQHEEAMTLYKNQETLCEVLENQKGLASSYGNQACVLSDLGHSKEALNLYRKAKKIYEDIGDKQGLLFSYINEGGVLFEGLNRQSEGIALTKKALDLSRDLKASQTEYLEGALAKYEQTFALSA